MQAAGYQVVRAGQSTNATVPTEGFRAALRQESGKESFAIPVGCASGDLQGAVEGFFASSEITPWLSIGL
ncbi:hypothetical protein [Bosea sp. (in: a-proteobacteria)]|uniref:hypothetical protein n=1 Tax=Bosea sp. (in: a-proteobacteria) TaxID=1871050 RepID=UPI0025C385F1|nr:hypothetical protein [Bosea sp. (in: a-proteobacteria)]MBR3193547.1 hypothetical protein [Bosea sp. (in: a-proteobacteria)]